MTADKLEKGEELTHLLGHYDLQIRKLKEGIAFMEKHGEEYHYHVEVKTFQIVKYVTSWHFLPQYMLEMMKPQLAKMEQERAGIQAEFDAL